MLAAVIFTTDDRPGKLEKTRWGFSASSRRDVESPVASRGEYLICSEIDCIKHSGLLGNHVELAAGPIVTRIGYGNGQASKAATQPP